MVEFQSDVMWEEKARRQEKDESKYGSCTSFGCGVVLSNRGTLSPNDRAAYLITLQRDGVLVARQARCRRRLSASSDRLLAKTPRTSCLSVWITRSTNACRFGDFGGVF